MKVVLLIAHILVINCTLWYKASAPQSIGQKEISLSVCQSHQESVLGFWLRRHQFLNSFCQKFSLEKELPALAPLAGDTNWCVTVDREGRGLVGSGVVPS